VSTIVDVKGGSVAGVARLVVRSAEALNAEAADLARRTLKVSGQALPK